MLSDDWKEFCRRGRYPFGNQVASVERCMGEDGIVRGYHSDIPLNPNLPNTDAMYPSHDHITHPKDDAQMVVDARVINDMKTIISEEEFWLLIDHLYAVGRGKRVIPSREAQRHNDWKPSRDFS